MIKIKIDYRYLILILLFILIVSSFTGCNAEFVINAYATETTEITESTLSSQWPEVAKTYNCTLVTMSDGTQIALPTDFLNTYKNYIVYRTNSTENGRNFYYVVIPDLQNYNYSSTSISFVRISDGTTLQSTAAYIQELATNNTYTTYPTFKLYPTSDEFVEGDNIMYFDFWESPNAKWWACENVCVYSTSDTLAVDNETNFFMKSLWLATTIQRLEQTTGAVSGIMSETVSLICLVVSVLLSLLAFKKCWIFLKKNLLS